MAGSRLAALTQALLAWMERVGRQLDGLAATHWGC
jgi:hypothetical protein